MRLKLLFLFAVNLTLTLPAKADVKMPAIFSDHMVLRKTAKVPIWGNADPGEKITILFNGKNTSTTAGPEGKWRTNLDLSQSGPGPYELIIRGKNEIKITDVLVGEVWLAAGQSNMEWPLAQTRGASEEIPRSGNPRLRQFQGKKGPSTTPTDALEGSWVVADPSTTGKFTAVGYYFGQRLEKTLKTPVGIISCSMGGTPSESWTSAEALRSDSELKKSSEQLWSEIPVFSDRLQRLKTELPPWLKSTGREDAKTSDPALFAGLDVSTDTWTPVHLPGLISGPNLPAQGVIWLRKDIDISTDPDKDLTLNIGEPDRFEVLYWNGKLLKEYTYEDYSSKGPRRSFVIPKAEVRKGRNVIALRIFAPINAPGVDDEPYGFPIPEPDQWLAKAEATFPPLAADAPPAPIVPRTLPYPHHVPSSLFNSMINPLIPYAINGVIWYQGESNTSRAFQYRRSFPLLIKDWRSQWGQGDFPFYFCQLANFDAKTVRITESKWAELREAQSLALSQPNTHQAVLIDIGDAADVHARNKKDVGERLAQIALANQYGKKLGFSGPVYRSMKVEGDKIRLTFDPQGKGLVAKPIPKTYIGMTGQPEEVPRGTPRSVLDGFIVCGDDRQWAWANAEIKGNDVIVWSDQVKKPVAVRYCWSNNPNGNLSNETGLPTSPFRTDDFPLTTEKNKLW